VPTPIPLAARYKTCVCACSLAGIVGLNTTGTWMSVCCECCVFGRGLYVGLITASEYSYRVCVCVWCVYVVCLCGVCVWCVCGVCGVCVCVVYVCVVCVFCVCVVWVSVCVCVCVCVLCVVCVSVVWMVCACGVCMLCVYVVGVCGVYMVCVCVVCMWCLCGVCLCVCVCVIEWDQVQQWPSTTTISSQMEEIVRQK